MAANRRRTSKPPKFNVVPDRLDLRDRPYTPSIALVPPARLRLRTKLPMLDQGDTSACTGFALATVVNFLLRRGSAERAAPVAPFMLYSMARRYDEFPGATEDTGSSLRGAMKGWYKHGVCRQELWRTEPMPDAARDPAQDWWLDAVQRPLGAYFRVETRSITDMHVALNETGILYASAICHRGWLRGLNLRTPPKETWTIPALAPSPADGGHAFAIVGYDETGFLIQNSWGRDWGSQGLAVLSYEDWLDNAMDCWVAQLGVVTAQHRVIAGAVSLRIKGKKVQLAGEVNLRNREIAPFVVDMENNGRLSGSGSFRTQPGDVEALLNLHLEQARKAWRLRPTDPIDIAIYAHGGLTGENDAAGTAANWIPALYEAQIFPVFLMWETGFWDTVKNRLEDLVKGQPRPTAGLTDLLSRFWNQRIERLLAAPGSVIWGEMKDNANGISRKPVDANGPPPGGLLLYEYSQKSPIFTQHPVRLHLVGHSAGGIVHCHVVDRLAKLGWTFETVNLMAPAMTVELFKSTIVPAIGSKTVKRYHQFHLSDAAEQQDPTCRPVLGYGRSLLYLVSESFEKGVRTPIAGMEKYFDDLVKPLGLKQIKAWSAPSAISSSTTHGGFDDVGESRETATMQSIIRLIKTGGI